MRSIGGFEAPRWLCTKSPKAAGSRTSEAMEIFCGKSDSRYSQRPETWQMGGHHDLSPFDLNAAGGSPLDETECARKRPPTSLGYT